MSNEKALQYLATKFDDFYYFENRIQSQNWKDIFLTKSKQLEQAAFKKTMIEFKKVFIDSWKKKNILPLIKKLDLSFQVHVNNDIKYLISNKVATTTKFGGQGPKIQLNQESLSFDLVFENHKN